MKYRSSKILEDFEFHDAQFTFESFDDQNLEIAVRYLNIRKSAEQNPHSKDMEIELARITFQGIHFISFDPGRTWKRDETGGLYTDEPEVIYEGKAAEKKILSNLRSGIIVWKFGVLNNGNYCFDGAGDEPWFEAQFSCESAFIEWDAYKNPAWYEERPFQQHIPCQNERNLL